MVSDHNNEYRRANAAALRLLGLCDRSKNDLRERLSKKGYSAEVVESVISKLESYDYINDERYAMKYSADAVRKKNLGPVALRYRLQQKGINSGIIEEAVSKVFKDDDEKEVASRAMRKKLEVRSNKLEVRKEDIKRLSDYLRRKGFSYDIIRQTLMKIGKEDDI